MFSCQWSVFASNWESICKPTERAIGSYVSRANERERWHKRSMETSMREWTSVRTEDKFLKRKRAVPSLQAKTWYMPKVRRKWCERCMAVRNGLNLVEKRKSKNCSFPMKYVLSVRGHRNIASTDRKSMKAFYCCCMCIIQARWNEFKCHLRGNLEHVTVETLPKVADYPFDFQLELRCDACPLFGKKNALN